MKKRLFVWFLALAMVLIPLSGCAEKPKELPRLPEDSPKLQAYDAVSTAYFDYSVYTPGNGDGFIIGEDLYNPEDIETYRYESNTVFEGSEELAAELLEAAKNPGLGIRALHEQGITGEGVNVAIIDQNLLLDHPEYKDSIAAYYDSGCEADGGSMHGPAVLSILAGKTLGVAPGAKVYFAAAPSWFQDASYFADCLYWIIEQNEALPEGEKIRVVSVSSAPVGGSSGSYKSSERWTEAVAAAEQAGILVMDCRHGEDTCFTFSSYYDREDPENVEKCQPGYPSFDDRDYMTSMWDSVIFAPASFRTVALEIYDGEYVYTYWGSGGESWAVPYVAGVLALGWQVNPDLDNETIKDLLFQSCYINENGNYMINPPAFIELVEATK